jgi:hypothetical protein
MKADGERETGERPVQDLFGNLSRGPYLGPGCEELTPTVMPAG